VISGNAHKYPVSAQCKILGIARATYYAALSREPKSRIDDAALAKDVKRIYDANRCVYGARKIKQKLDEEGITASRRRITRVMKSQGLISAYTKKKYRSKHTEVNQADMPNVLDRKFDGYRPLDALTSDLTYVRVANRWAYTCLFLDLSNREIVGHAASWNKDAKLVKAAFASMDASLYDVNVFHTD
jgi:transposase InsO family protein